MVPFDNLTKESKLNCRPDTFVTGQGHQGIFALKGAPLALAFALHFLVTSQQAQLVISPEKFTKYEGFFTLYLLTLWNTVLGSPQVLFFTLPLPFSHCAPAPLCRWLLPGVQMYDHLPGQTLRGGGEYGVKQS